ncbi:carbohydrate ABC transporter permease [Paenibacillus aurantius]|uniref:Carbohydrate ABC transporter permease n=1 Tax=Paenibacillus aurantius TaxID=2918900 RepID=A0AA96LCP5_9BACL|nr:carbohydrate ABC transporter permease [Paenibacillus aurantius]WNQ10729.1 carbohydrate ABC transporter permease [Paenibacillus aurantius]
MKSRSWSGFVFDTANTLVLLALCASTLYPFLYLLSISLSPSDISFTQIHIIPPKFTWANYHTVLGNASIWSGFTMSALRTAVGTVLTLTVTVLTAYVLSKRYYPQRNLWTMYIVFTMFVHGGLIPNYLLVKSLGMINSVSALLLPQLIHTFQMIIARNFFLSLPEEVEESAKIDGANDFVILFRIVVPVSMPIIATLGLWTAVWHWNAWFDSIIYITDASKQVLQVVMRRIALEGKGIDLLMKEDVLTTPESIKAATVMVTTLPILLVYPFAQKYFVKGVLVGSLKG